MPLDNSILNKSEITKCHALCNIAHVEHRYAFWKNIWNHTCGKCKLMSTHCRHQLTYWGWKITPSRFDCKYMVPTTSTKTLWMEFKNTLHVIQLWCFWVPSVILHCHVVMKLRLLFSVMLSSNSGMCLTNSNHIRHASATSLDKPSWYT